MRGCDYTGKHRGILLRALYILLKFAEWNNGLNIKLSINIKNIQHKNINYNAYRYRKITA